MTDELTAAVARLRSCLGVPAQWGTDVRLVLYALESAQAAMPPREPTQAMEDAGLAYWEGRAGNRIVSINGIWRAMHDAWTNEQTSGPGEQPSPQACTEPDAADASDALERLEKEQIAERAVRRALRDELSAERDRHKRAQERAERAEAERDALLAIVRAADAVWKTVSQTPDRMDAMAAYFAARAKVKLP